LSLQLLTITTQPTESNNMKYYTDTLAMILTLLVFAFIGVLFALGI
jgi:hypothetical protein